MNKKFRTKMSVIWGAVGIGLVSAFVYVYANSGETTIPKVELDTKFQTADSNKDGVLNETEFAGYLANLRQVQTTATTTATSVNVTTTSDDVCNHDSSESDCCGGEKTTKVVAAESSKNKGGCCGGGMTKVAETTNPSKNGGGCCGGM
jgi:hypothetical protein